ncbi:MAG: undecaprenyldiphospho-muramoylpentapeptide beta-N-acetylglucosaminyltransferase [Oligoflexia bacterium]|nr:undecaprenyldiphospho-muramoylpentapeptide beta-N-acetylglucosaminyltransferase [Oligoflexia bacterium]
MAGPKVLIAASGTGGHLLPALAIAQALRERGTQVEFVGSGRPLEERLIVGAGFVRHIVQTVGVKRRGLSGWLEFFFTLPRAVLQTWRLISAFQPDVVVGVGGYASVLPVLVAWLRGLPSWIHEAELRAGLANAVLSFFATRVSLAFEEARLPCMSRARFTGHPIRKELLVASKEVGQKPSPKHLLVMGGSQGAQALDQAMLALAHQLKELGVELTHQCREENVQRVESGYKQAALKARVLPFIADMAATYAWSDAVVCRAGAGTVMEIEALNIPALFVPYPFAQGNHQAANARTLVRKGKALMVEEGADFERRLGEALNQLLNTESFHALQTAPCDRRSLHAADDIAAGIIELARV